MKKEFTVIIFGTTITLVAIIVAIIVIGNKTAPSRELSKALDLGNKYLTEQNYEEAVIAFNRAIEIEPTNVDAYLGIADSYIGLTNQNMPADAMVASAKDEMISNLDPYNLSDGAEEKVKIESLYAPALKYCDDVLKTLKSGYELTSDEAVKTKIDEITELKSAIERIRDDIIDAVMSALDDARTTDSDLASANVGDIVNFGALNGQPVEWDVLDKSDGKVLLISHCILDEHIFDQKELSEYLKQGNYYFENDAEGYAFYVIGGEDYIGTLYDTNWEISEIRSWLNEEFINQLFDSKQIARIQDTKVSNPNSKAFYSEYYPEDMNWYRDNTKLCGDTVDKLFLLSWEELIKYYGPLEYGDPANWGKGIYYAPSASAKNLLGDNVRWWLRSDGTYSSLAMFIDENGSVSNGYLNVCFDDGVRPALWVCY